jgi:hypothetical protein
VMSLFQDIQRCTKGSFPRFDTASFATQYSTRTGGVCAFMAGFVYCMWRLSAMRMENIGCPTRPT